MMQRWQKLGLVYSSDERVFLPTPFAIHEGRLRLYAAFVNSENVGRIRYLEVDANNPLSVLRVSEHIVMDIGAPGAFDDSGVTPSCIVSMADGTIRLYYIGWQRQMRVPYTLLTGLALSTDAGERFTRVTTVPILDRRDGELFFRTAANVRQDDGLWRAWYVGGGRWVKAGEKYTPSYELRYTESADGVHWISPSRTAFALDASRAEVGLGRPFVMREKDRYRMWYSYRSLSQPYRIGYAESSDGLRWIRKDDEVGITVSDSGWDSEMVCYCCLCATKSGTYMFYNGNGYGRTGIGVARLIE